LTTRRGYEIGTKLWIYKSSSIDHGGVHPLLYFVTFANYGKDKSTTNRLLASRIKFSTGHQQAWESATKARQFEAT
jgi:hypothetical protein